MKKLLVILLGVLTTGAIAQNNPKYLNVLASSGLNMRSQPDARSRIITNVPFGKKVEVQEKTKTQLKSGWIKDNWYRVKYRGREGYIFGGYLSELPTPNGLESVRSLPELLMFYCHANFKPDGTVITTIEESRGDSLVHTLQKYLGGIELETEKETNRHSSSVILKTTTEKAYVLLEAILKQNGNQKMVSQLRFVTNNDGSLKRISTSDGAILIRELSDELAEIKLTAFD